MAISDSAPDRPGDPSDRLPPGPDSGQRVVRSTEPGRPCAVVVDGVPREAVVVRVRGERAYVKYDEGTLYRCAWVPTSELAPA